MKKNIFIITAMLAVMGTAMAQEIETTTNRMFRTGYRADIQLEANTYKQSFISTSHGYSFGSGLYIGGGAAFGVEYQPGFESDPAYLSSLFVDGKYTLTQWRVAPFVALRTGSIITIEETPAGRFFVNPAVGVDWGHISIKVGYEFQTSAGSMATFGLGFNF